MLKGKHLSYRYQTDGPWILTNTSIDIRPGEVVGLSGYSGQGKTTLAKLLSGYVSPLKGDVRIDDQPLPAHGFCPVQLVFQHPERAFNPQLTLMDSLREAGPLSTDLLEKFHVEQEWLQRKPHELSGGELQRMAIARVLQPETRFIICDEITTMLDVLSQAAIWDIIYRCAKETNVGVLAISHNRFLMKKVCDRILDIASIQSN